MGAQEVVQGQLLLNSELDLVRAQENGGVWASEEDRTQRVVPCCLRSLVVSISEEK